MSIQKLPRVCIIGAGPSGITTAKRLKDHGVPFDCFEASDEVGGVWYFDNPNDMSACYQSLHIDTSKWRLAFEDYPVPAEWPDFPHHSLLFQYFKDYTDHFGLRDRITFNTRVLNAERAIDGQWSITLSTGETREYDALVVCNGHHWDPNIPDYPGEFDGTLMHSHAYKDPFTPVDMRGKNIVVVGMGNSGLDIASELSQRFLAKKLTVSARRGVWVLPKYLQGVAGDKLEMPGWMPRWLQLGIQRRFLAKNLGTMEGYGLPKPDHKPFEAHPSASGEFLGKAGGGDIKFKPAIAALEGKQVRFADGSVEDVDVIVCATGYHISFPFFSDPEFLPDSENRFPLYKRMMKPGVNNLFFMGLAQSKPTLVNFAEQQSKLLVAYLTGKYMAPDAEEMQRVIKADEDYYLGPFYKSPRHTIQLEFDVYVKNMEKELIIGGKRAKAAGFPLPVPARAMQNV